MWSIRSTNSSDITERSKLITPLLIRQPPLLWKNCGTAVNAASVVAR